MLDDSKTGPAHKLMEQAYLIPSIRLLHRKDVAGIS